MGLPTLIQEFPYIKCPVIASDNEYPALDWVRYACKNMTSRFAETPSWFKDRVNFSRYSYIPVGNLHENDAPLFIIDTLYSRNLTMNKHILWFSETSKPDLGGHEEKDFRIYFQEEMENPEIVKKGFYRGYTVELQIDNFAVNAIVQSEFMKDFEEATQIANQLTEDKMAKNSKNKGQAEVSHSEFDTDLDEYVTCASAFKKLKELVIKWLEDSILKKD